jgi:membrane associated rhomboid family serine protease
MSIQTPAPSRGPLVTAAIPVVVFVALLWVLEIVDTLLGGRLDGYGIQPLQREGLDGILFAPLLHSGFPHLLANSLPLLVLGFLIALSGVRELFWVTAVVWTVGGVGTWLIGGAYTNHIGASGLVFGWLVHLLVRGFFARSLSQIALGVVVFALYGSILWGVLPTQPGVSWQGHLFGALGGLLAAWQISRRPTRGRAEESYV